MEAVYWGYVAFVEQWAEEDGMPRNKVQSPENIVPIPKLKHWEIDKWLGEPNPEYKNDKNEEISPREYAKGKRWETRYQFGLDALKRLRSTQTMTNADLQFLTDDQLVHRFADIGVQQDKAEQAEHDSKYKRLFF